MASLTIRDLPQEVHDALRKRAARHGWSVEDEARAILLRAIAISEAEGFGQQLRAYFADCRGDELDVKRDPTPAAGAEFDE